MEYIVIIVPLIVGLMQVAKNTGLDTKYVSLLNLVLGVGFAFLFPVSPFIQETLIIGIMAGLSAGGSYDIIKPVIQKQ